MKIFKLRAEEKIYQILELPVKYRIIGLGTVSPWPGILHAYMGPHIFRKCFSVLKFLKVIFSFILHPLILRKSMCYGSRRGPLPNNTSCHLIAKLKKVIIILRGPTGRSPGSPTGQSAPAYDRCPVVLNLSNSYKSKCNSFYRSSLSLNAKCNMACDCDRSVYNPGCGSDGRTYFSPCYAGCLSKSSSKVKDRSKQNNTA